MRGAPLPQNLFSVWFFLLLRNIIRECTSFPMSVNFDEGDTDPVGGYKSSINSMRINIDAVLIQRTGLGSITTYHLADDPNGHPIFTRSRKDFGKKFVVFSNPTFPGGSGHFIVLKRIENQQRAPDTKRRYATYIFYEAFVLNFQDTLYGSVTDLDPNFYVSVQTRMGKSSLRHDHRARIASKYAWATG